MLSVFDLDDDCVLTIRCGNWAVRGTHKSCNHSVRYTKKEFMQLPWQAIHERLYIDEIEQKSRCSKCKKKGASVNITWPDPIR